MKWLTTYNDWATKVGNRFSDWFFDRTAEWDTAIRKYVPAIGMTCVFAFIAFVVFLGYLEVFRR